MFGHNARVGNDGNAAGALDVLDGLYGRYAGRRHIARLAGHQVSAEPFLAGGNDFFGFQRVRHVRAGNGIGRAGENVFFRNVYARLLQLADDFAYPFAAVGAVLLQKRLEFRIVQIQVVSGKMQVVVFPGAYFHARGEQNAVFFAHGFGAAHAVGSVVVGQRVNGYARFQRGQHHFFRRAGAVRKVGMGVQIHLRHIKRVPPRSRRGPIL